MIAIATTAGLVLALGLLLPVLLWWVLRVAGREERAMADEIARAQARALGRSQDAAGAAAGGSGGGARPRNREAA